MSLFRTETETAIHDLLVACREAEELMADSARQTDDDRIAAFFADAARSMGNCASVLADDSCSLGDLPGAPDQDSLSLRAAVTSLVAALSEDERVALVEDAVAAHRAVADAADQAIGIGLPESMARDVEKCRHTAAQVLSQLEELQARLRPGAD